VSEAIAIDDDAEIGRLGLLDCVADTVGGNVRSKLLSRVKPGGTFGCFPPTPEAALYPTIHIQVLFGQLDPATASRITRHYAEAVRDGKLTIPIDHIMPLSEAAEAHAIAEKGGSAKIVLTI
jgi:NADPH:quinone reductase-like Zn-dependent oxidoreductase